MATKTLRIGSMEDIIMYDDSEYDAALSSDHTIKITQVPIADEDVIRKADIPGISDEVSENVWPVGSVFLSVVDTDPNTLLGFGTWSRIAEGEFLVGFKSGDADFGISEGTGGSKTHTHDTDVDIDSTTSDGPSETTEVDNNLDDSTVNVASNNHTHDTDPVLQTFTSGDNSDLPPYFTIYVWKRTA